MIKYFVLLLTLMIQVAVTAQTNVKNTMGLLQECLNLNANNQRDVLKLYEQTGIMEYALTGIQQRIKLADLQKVEVKENNAGFSVELKCSEENACISFIKNDTSNSAISGTAIQFSDMTLANTFAENLSTLISHYKTTEAPLEKTLAKNAQGKVPLLGVKTAPENKPVAAREPAPEIKEPADDDEPKVKAAAPKLSREEREEARAEKKEETQRKAEESREAKREARKNKKAEKEDASENAVEETEEKTTPRSKRRAAREATEEEPAEPAAEERQSTRRSKTSGNKLIEDVGDAGTTDEKGKGGNDFCNQLNSILQSGKENKFKSIEGKLTNAETKINESKVKLKGTRKNYLSWFKKERAFISELKSGNDYEQILKEFEGIQTQLDECLGAGWDMEDRSNSEEYAKLKTEVKDVEFKNENDATMPTVRVIFLEDNEKFTMFMRIK